MKRRRGRRKSADEGRARSLCMWNENPAMQFHESDMTAARRHVLRGKRLVGRQEKLVLRLKRFGINASEAQELLTTMRSVQRTFEDHLRQIAVSLGQTRH